MQVVFFMSVSKSQQHNSMKYKLYDKWNSYDCLPDNKNWDLSSYTILLNNINSVEEVIALNDKISSKIITNERWHYSSVGRHNKILMLGVYHLRLVTKMLIRFPSLTRKYPQDQKLEAKSTLLYALPAVLFAVAALVLHSLALSS